MSFDALNEVYLESFLGVYLTLQVCSVGSATFLFGLGPFVHALLGSSLLFVLGFSPSASGSLLRGH